MRNIEQVVGWFLLREKLLDLKQLSINLVESDGKIFIAIRIFERDYKFELTKYLWGTIEQVYETCIATQMLQQGYVQLTIEGGWLIYNPEGEDYQIQDQSCTCGDFLYNRKGKSRCKHLVFRDWHLNYRKRIVELKSLIVQQ